MSETYTAVYERVGDGWLATVAEEPRVNGRGATPAQARQRIREALASCLTADPESLHIVDTFRMPSEIRAAQQDVKAARTDSDRSRMLESMTNGRTAAQWVEDLGLGDRDPKTVEWLKGLTGTIEIDHLCSTITMAEDMSRYHGPGEADHGPEADRDPEEELPAHD